MKNSVLLLFAVLIIGCSASNPLDYVTKSTPHGNLTIRLNNATLLNNNNVGQNWTNGLYIDINGNITNVTNLNYEYNVNVPANAIVEIVAWAKENDKYPDFGSATLRLTTLDINPGKIINYDSVVTVRENRGRYSGNTAQWRFTYSVERTL